MTTINFNTLHQWCFSICSVGRFAELFSLDLLLQLLKTVKMSDSDDDLDKTMNLESDKPSNRNIVSLV